MKTNKNISNLVTGYTTRGIQIVRNFNTIDVFTLSKYHTFKLTYPYYFIVLDSKLNKRLSTKKRQLVNKGKSYHYSLNSAKEYIRTLFKNNILQYNAIRKVTQVFQKLEKEHKLEQFRLEQTQALKIYQESLGL